ncbi:MAG TPA: deoxyribodipyrimidine photo-lyase [Acidobacteriaceae bacterium]|jgi:deoxyribodipyrimidine photo-lyase|nr:deoxyribodipyrimidine photo-lyase [Acidobacteriaceae bacterium]
MHAKTSQKNSALPDALAKLSEDPRVTVRLDGAPRTDGKCVVYWMQRAQRGRNNLALDVAADIANELRLPLLVFFSAISNYPHANWRHYYFLNRGLIDVAEDLTERNISFVVRRQPNNAIDAFAAEVGAAIVIGDENVMRGPERWRVAMSKKLTVPFWTVDADVVVPTKHYGKALYGAYVIRPKLYAAMPEFLVPYKNPRVKARWSARRGFENFDVRNDITADWGEPGGPAFDRSVKPVDSFKGGAHEAQKRLKHFITSILPDYDTSRNKPEIDGTSRMSPYLHFGHIGPVEIALAVEHALAKNPHLKAARDSFFNEVLVWRELSVAFVKYNPHYDNMECAENWAQQTLAEHASDPRNPQYTLAQLDRGETYDELWNAAQTQMVQFGWMHNYMRMYWAKKILEWAPDPKRAFEWCLHLNDKYFLDGRDPNGHSGIAWAVAGKHDRPWFDRPIFGKIRYMSGASTGRKFDLKKYIAQMKGLEQPALW